MLRRNLGLRNLVADTLRISARSNNAVMRHNFRFAQPTISVRLNSTESINSTTSAAAEKTGMDNEKLDKAKNARMQNRQKMIEENRQKFNSTLQEFDERLKKLIEEASLGESFEFLTTNLNQMKEAFPYQRSYMFSTVLNKSLEKLIQKSIACQERLVEDDESADLTSALVTPQKILEYLITVKIAFNNEFMDVIYYLTKSGHYEEGLQLYVTYLGYLKESTNNSMEKYNYNVQIAGFITYLLYIANNKIDPEKVFVTSTFDKIQSVGQLPSKDKIISILKKNLNVQDPAQIEKVLEYYKKCSRIMVDLNDNKILTQLQNASANGHIYRVTSIFNDLKSVSKDTNQKIPETVYVELMNIYNKHNSSKFASDIWNEMISSGVKPGIEAYNSLIITFSKFGEIKSRLLKIDTLYEDYILKNESVKANSNTYAALIAAYTNIHEFDKVDQLYNKLLAEQYSTKSMPQKIIKAYLIGLSKVNVEQSYSLFTELIDQHKFNPDTDIINNYLSIYTKMKKISNVNKVIQLLTKYNLHPDIATYTTLINLMFSQAKLRGEVVSEETLNQLLQEMEANNINMSFVTYNTILNGLMKDGANVAAGRLLFKMLMDQKIIPNRTMLTAMIQGEFASTDGADKFDKYAHIENYFKIYLKTHKSASKNEAQMFNLMIRNYAYDNNLNKALEYLNKISELGMIPNNFSFYPILNKCLDMYQKDNKDKRVQGMVTKVLTSSMIPELEKRMKSLESSNESTLNSLKFMYGNEVLRVLKSLEKRGIVLPNEISALISKY